MPQKKHGRITMTKVQYLRWTIENQTSLGWGGAMWPLEVAIEHLEKGDTFEQVAYALRFMGEVSMHTLPTETREQRRTAQGMEGLFRGIADDLVATEPKAFTALSEDLMDSVDFLVTVD